MLRREGKWVRGLMHSMEFLWVYICIGGWGLISLSAINNAILFTLAPKASQSLHGEVALRVFASSITLRNGIALACTHVLLSSSSYVAITLPTSSPSIITLNSFSLMAATVCPGLRNTELNCSPRMGSVYQHCEIISDHRSGESNIQFSKASPYSPKRSKG